jgi:hypothetical protein
LFAGAGDDGVVFSDPRVRRGYGRRADAGHLPSWPFQGRGGDHEPSPPRRRYCSGRPFDASAATISARALRP